MSKNKKSSFMKLMLLFFCWTTLHVSNVHLMDPNPEYVAYDRLDSMTHGADEEHSHAHDQDLFCDPNCKISSNFQHSHSSHNNDHKHETLMVDFPQKKQNPTFYNGKFLLHAFNIEGIHSNKIDKPPIT